MTPDEFREKEQGYVKTPRWLWLLVGTAALVAIAFYLFLLTNGY